MVIHVVKFRNVDRNELIVKAFSKLENAVDLKEDIMEVLNFLGMGGEVEVCEMQIKDIHTQDQVRL